PAASGPSTPNCGSVQCVRVRSTGHAPATPLNADGPQAVIEAVFSHNGPATFQYAVQGKSNVTLHGGSLLDGYNPSTGCGTPPCPYSNSGPSKNSLNDGDVFSNANITIQGGAVLDGDATAHGTVTNSGTVNGGIITNGAPTKSVNPDPVP